MKDKHGHVVISAVCCKRNSKSLYCELINEWKLYLSVYVFSYKLMGDTVK